MGKAISQSYLLPYGRQTIEDDDVAAIAAAVQDDYLTTGPTVQRFESEFSAATDALHACACNSGTAALHLAAMALDLGPGDAIVLPAMTFVATANAARYVGAEVIFADVDPETGLVGPDHIEEALKREGQQRVRAIAVVHLNGQCVDVEAISQIAMRRDLWVIEDACHALGAEYRVGSNVWAKVGACASSDIACFSLHPVKMITTGEGGMVTTNHSVLADRVRRLRNHGMSKDINNLRNRDLAFDTNGTINPWYYEVAELGYNYRLPDVLCALGLNQLKKLSRFVMRRRQLAAHYDRLLLPLAPSIQRVAKVSWSSHAYHLYVVRIDFAKLGISRAEVMARLVKQKIGTQVHYLPVHLQPYYSDRYGASDLPGAQLYYEQCLSLPIFPAMRDADVERVVEALYTLML